MGGRDGKTQRSKERPHKREDEGRKGERERSGTGKTARPEETDAEPRDPAREDLERGQGAEAQVWQFVGQLGRQFVGQLGRRNYVSLAERARSARGAR